MKAAHTEARAVLSISEDEQIHKLMKALLIVNSARRQGITIKAQPKRQILEFVYHILQLGPAPDIIMDVEIDESQNYWQPIE
jgi:hypothetical protein